jgi:oleate hydratase
MPFITSQFLRRAHGDRPQVVPRVQAIWLSRGQFRDLPDDVVFTVEDSVRSAQAAVYALPSIEESSTRASATRHSWRCTTRIRSDGPWLGNGANASSPGRR